ncbi:ATP-dependent RNA helicase DbpA [Castellaniella ginsengisoli]|uniref:ATP-dependent RNA helicase DbpA n=1 Tax=Castellaniella ginsengisoli TaxID=546114 RepID=A0AB39DD79_9BURK
MTTLPFSQLPLSPAQLDNLASMGYLAMTPIQAQSLPVILAGRDLIAQAKTGSGKTAAFGLGILHRLDPARWAPQALVVCPTRELSEQVATELRRLARAAGNVKVLTLTGGASARPQNESLAHGAHVIVGTPGRLLDHLARQTLDLSAVSTLVLDEADRMVDMGFFPDVMQIAHACPYKRQTVLFSATYPESIRADAEHLLTDPEFVKVDAVHSEGQIEQHFYEIEAAERFQAAAALLRHFQPESALAFCNTKAACAELSSHLKRAGFSALALHGDMDQRDRDDVLAQFSNHSSNILVATDVAARGLDIASLPMVINVELARDPQVHTHRVGRTGRMQETGLALSLCAPDEQYVASRIAQQDDRPLHLEPLPRQKTAGRPAQAPMVTLLVLGGKKAKLRPGDLLGALTGDGGLTREQVGKIQITDQVSYVALSRAIAHRAFPHLENILIKGKKQRMKLLS